MAKYCDSQTLEKNWYLWLLATHVPDLEPFRQVGSLHTRVIISDQGENVKICAPSIPKENDVLEHIISEPYIKFTSKNGIIDIDLPKPQVPTNDCKYEGFIKEQPTKQSWDYVGIDMWKICKGLSCKFYLHTEEDYNDLISESFMQIMGKIARRKLIFVPGKAPVFNLCTTAVHRVMCTVTGRMSKWTKNISRLAADVGSGTVPLKTRSLKTMVHNADSRKT